MSDAVLSVQAVSLKLGGTRVLKRIDLEVRPSRCLVIMGANGAGKSQLLRMLNGLAVPDEGQVLSQGGPLDRAARDRQAMVFQRPVLLRRSVAANLRFALTGRQVTRADRAKRVNEALEMARLTGRADRPARTLSGGEQQRLAIARALITRPDVLLLDEPTASLDPGSTRAVEQMINAARLAGVTVVLVTHDAGQARRLGDDVAFLQRGRLVASGEASTVLGAAAPPPVRAWLDGRLLPDGEED